MTSTSILLPFNLLEELKTTIRESRIPEVFIAYEAYENKKVVEGYLEDRIMEKNEKLRNEGARGAEVSGIHLLF